MSKDIISAVFTFAILIGGTAAIGSELLSAPQAPQLVARQTLPAVVVTGKRVVATAVAAQDAVAEPTQLR